MTKQLARQRAAASNMADELATLASSIYKAEEEVQELKDAIKKGDEVAMQALGFDGRGEAKASLARLEEHVNELLKKKNLLRQQQQQSGAVVITLIKLKPKKREEEVSFDQPPTLQHINASVENLFDECKREDFELRCGKERIDSEQTLQTLCSRSRAFTIAIISCVQPFSSYKNDQGLQLLGVLDLKLSEFMLHMGRDLALRCLEGHPGEHGTMRELISPIIFAAAALTEDIRVLAEYGVHGTRASGSIDWVLLFKRFSIVIVE
eukprot:997-Heterococcus_DN1.PRE.3